MRLCCRAPAPPSCSAPSPSQTGHPLGWGHCRGRAGWTGGLRGPAGRSPQGPEIPHGPEQGRTLHWTRRGPSPSSEIISCPPKPTAELAGPTGLGRPGRAERALGTAVGSPGAQRGHDALGGGCLATGQPSLALPPLGLFPHLLNGPPSSQPGPSLTWPSSAICPCPPPLPPPHPHLGPGVHLRGSHWAWQ